MSRFAVGQRVSRRRPCPVCGKPDWCAFSSDGRFALCQRLDAWNGQPAIRSTDGGWLHGLDERRPQRLAPGEPTPRPALARPQLDAAYCRLAELRGLDEYAREDLIVKRRFPQALDGDALYFSLPRSGGPNEEVSEKLVAEFGQDVIEGVPGFAVTCRRCDGAGVVNSQGCRPCRGLGKMRPRFRSVRGERHDYALIGCDETGLAFWGLSRRLPYGPNTDGPKYLLLSSSRAMDASVAGLPKYHVAGRQFPVRDAVLITEGIIKAEVTAHRLQCRVIGIYSTSIDEPTLAAVKRLVEAWRCE